MIGGEAFRGWLSESESRLAAVVRDTSERNLRAYEVQPLLVDEHAGQEEDMAHGGYGRRQILELIQNGADEQITKPGGRVEIVLTDDVLYCANEGTPITEKGINALLLAQISPKRGSEIGRFGLGFKSVLGVTSRPEFFCRDVSFGFDAEWAARKIAKRVPGKESYPVLRLARLLDPAKAGAQDTVLADLMSWATTVVRLPLDKHSEWLASDIDDFRTEFLLFSPHVGTVVLDDRTRSVRREVSVHTEGDEVLLTEGKSTRRWRIFQSVLRPSDEAKRDAGKLSHRKELPVVWAVPAEGRLEVGQFWAFFPLRDETTLSGIANAPWQINDDRTGLLEGSRLNRELLSALVDLALEHAPDLTIKDDPARVLDILPARGREIRCWADGVVTDLCKDREAQYPLIPDQTGQLRKASQVKIPDLAINHEALVAWSRHSARPLDWAHPSVGSSPTRRNRVERILEAARVRPQSAVSWIEALVADGPSPEHSADAIKVIDILAHNETAWGHLESQVRNAYIVLTGDDAVSRIDPNWIWIDPGVEGVTPKITTVHPDITADPAALVALQYLGIQPVTPELELEVWLEDADDGDADTWSTIWETSRRIEDPEAAAALFKKAWDNGVPFCVRTRSDRFRPIGRTLLPGPIIPDDSTDDPDVLIDVAYHSPDLEVLQRAGAAATPRVGWAARREPLLHEYERSCVSRYLRDVEKSGHRPLPDYLQFEETTTTGPLDPIRHLSESARARFTRALLDVTVDLTPWTISHRTMEKYPKLRFENPVVWVIGEHGYLETSQGPRRPKYAFGPGLQTWSALLPVADVPSEVAETLSLPSALTELTDRQWQECLGALASATDDRLIGAFYHVAAEHLADPPDPMRCRVGSTHEQRPPAEILVTDRTDTFEALRATGDPVIQVNDASGVDVLVQRWGLQPAAEHVSHDPSWIPVAGSVALVDAFPTLRPDIEDAGLGGYELTACSELRILTTTDRGTEARDRDYVVHHDQILYRADLGIEHLLRRLNDEYEFELSEGEIDALVQQTWKQQARERAASIRSQTTNAHRLLAAIGAETIRKRLPIGLLEAVRELDGEPTDEQLADLLLVVHGYDTLKELRRELEDAGFTPPERWGGSTNARRFVKDLGFSAEYAGFRSSSRDPALIVPGRVNLPELHDYQRRMVGEIRSLLQTTEEDRRGLLSLPTGAGKTRVAVQALTEAIVDGDFDRPVLWIAQSDELCEQAVEAWAEVWRSHGSEEQLTISRLWGPNEVDEAIEGSQVVVATPDKLRNRVGDDAYEWLQQSGCVIVDEAHAATPPEYTRIFEWQGISSRGGKTRTRVPLIGLTATPFRRNVQQTQTLVRRFGARRLDDVEMGEDPYATLQAMGVLSLVEGEALEGVAIEVDEAGAAEMASFRGDLPTEVYREIASDVDRNRRILHSIESKPDSWPILLFAVSTEHAHTMAALLSRKGIRAAAIDYSTDTALRRRYVDEFRSGRLRVLCNYNVLSQGFDAPKVRAIYVTRPTFSPNTYQQMIGRGLRGPLNGGEEYCLIVNVLDNWSRFGENLAYRDFEYLWKRD